jgi:hypothetical protein
MSSGKAKNALAKSGLWPMATSLWLAFEGWEKLGLQNRCSTAELNWRHNHACLRHVRRFGKLV